MRAEGLSLSLSASFAIFAAASLTSGSARADYTSDVLDQAFGYAFDACDQGLAGTRPADTAISDLERNVASAKSVGEASWPKTFRGRPLRESLAACQRDLTKRKSADEQKAKADAAASAKQADLEHVNQAAAAALRTCKSTLAVPPGGASGDSAALTYQTSSFRSQKQEVLSKAKAKGLTLGPLDGEPASDTLQKCEGELAKKLAAQQAVERAAATAKAQKQAAEKAAWDKEVAALRGDKLRVFKQQRGVRPEIEGAHMATASRWVYTDMVSPGRGLSYRCTTTFDFDGDKLAKKHKDGMGCAM